MNNCPTRKPNRLRHYDYSRNGAYFVTVCVKDGRELLGRIVGDDGNRPVYTESGIAVGDDGNRPVYIELSKYGKIVETEIKNIPLIRKEIRIDHYVIMPNHVHMIACITRDEGNRPAYTEPGGIAVGDDGNRPENQRADCHPPLRKSIPNMVQGFKGAVTRRIGFSIWQRSYNDHIIRNEEDYNRVAEYIGNNPRTWRPESDGIAVGDDGNRPAYTEPGGIAVGDDGNRPENTEPGGIAVGDDGNRPENQRADCHPPLRKSIPNMAQEPTR
jgi:REP element-mobilizing transposase RayT